MDIKKNPPPKPVTSTGISSAPQAKPTQGEIEAKSYERPIDAHIAFFMDMMQPGVVNSGSTKKGLDALGLKGVNLTIGGPALTAVFSIKQDLKDADGVKTGNGIIHALKADHVEIARIKEGIRADGSDTGIYNKDTGGINVDKFVEVWKQFAGDKNYLDEGDKTRLVKGKFPNGLEFGLLFEVASVITKDGTRAVPLDRALAFYDGSLFRDLANARAAGTLYKPTGVLVHDGVKQVAKSLSSQALQMGGVAAGEAAKAIHGGSLALEIDERASLELQQTDKNLISTFTSAFGATKAGTAIATLYAGAAKLMCPALPGALQAKAQPPSTPA
ncbi:MAG TPA: caleosin family protein [Myxococcota bacterium]